MKLSHIRAKVTVPAGREAGSALFLLQTSYSADEAELRRLLLDLDPVDRHRRFNTAVNDAFLIAHPTRALAQAGCVVGVFIDGRLRGIVEIRRERTGSSCAEAALVVAYAWRQRGLGQMLLQVANKFLQRARSTRFV